MGFGRTNSCTPVKKTQEKTVSITENGSLEIVPDNGYDAMSKVIATVGVSSEPEQAGGGLSLEYNRLKKIANGTFTVAERTAVDNDNRLILEHNAGVIPFLFVIRARKMSAQSDLDFIVTFRVPISTSPTSTSCYSYSSRRASSSSYRYTKYSVENGPTSSDKWDEQYVSIVSYNATLYLNTGIEYSWEAYYIE